MTVNLNSAFISATINSGHSQNNKRLLYDGSSVGNTSASFNPLYNMEYCIISGRISGAAFVAEMTSQAVPEPTTATLSLLALAGLAAASKKRVRKQFSAAFRLYRG